MDINQDFKKLVEMKGSVEHILFREFEKAYDFPKGLNSTHAMTMIGLKFHPMASMSEISYHLNLERGSFTTIADKLIRLEYIKSERGVKDRRIYHLTLTGKGMEFANEFIAQHIKYMEDIISKLGDEKKDEFFQAVDVISSVMRDIKDDTGLGPC